MGSVARAMPAWLFLISGLALLACVTIIPAQDRADEARWRSARARAMLEHGRLRLDRYERLEKALDAHDPSLVRSLIASQLNLVPADEVPGGPADGAIVLTSSRPGSDISAMIEPEMVALPARNIRTTRLSRLVTDPTSRLWVLGVGVFCCALGLIRRRF